MTERITRFVFSFRSYLALLVFIFTVFFLYEVRYVEVKYKPDDILPPDHSNVKLEKKMSDIFGGSNSISIGLTVKEGDIFTPQVLEKILRITERLESLPEVARYRIVSIASRKLRHIYLAREKVDMGGGRLEEFETQYNKSLLSIVASIVNDKKLDEISTLKKAIFTNPNIYGPIVSKDNKGTVILCDFFSEEAYKEIFAGIQKILADEKDSNVSFSLGGRPIMLAYLYQYTSKILYMFGLALIVTLLLLYSCFRTPRGVLAPLLCGAITVIWGLGLIGLFRFRMDILSLTIPFLTLAITLSHSVQVIKRYYEEFSSTKDNLLSSRNTLNGLMLPAFTSIVTDGAGFLSLALFPFRIIWTLGIATGIAILLIFLVVTIFLPILLSFLPPPGEKELAKATRSTLLDRLMAKIGGTIVYGKGRFAVLGVAFIFLILGLILSQRVVTGNTVKGSPYFWEKAIYNKDDRIINGRFAGTSPLYIYVDAKQDNGIYDPQLARDIDELQTLLRKKPYVGYVLSYVDFLKAYNMSWHNMDSLYYTVSDRRDVLASYITGFRTSLEPEVTRSYFELNKREAQIQILLKDNKAETINDVLSEIDRFLATKKKSDALIQPAAGLIGLNAAIIDGIDKSQTTNVILISVVTFIFCVICFRSFVGGLSIILALLVGKIIAFGVMGLGNIGLFLETVPVMAPGMGIGVDYSIYLLTRLRDEFKEGNDPRKAFIKAFTTSGKAVFYTAMSVALGVMVLYLSDLRFQAMMGVMLALVLFLNMLAAFLTLPALISLWKPRFIYGKK